MDSIKLLETTFGKYGKECHVHVSTSETLVGVYHGYSESTVDAPLVLRLGITQQEAERIGVPYLTEIGIPYQVITSVEF